MGDAIFMAGTELLTSKEAVSTHDSADVKNKLIWPYGSYGLFLTCGEKKRTCYTRNYTVIIIVKHKIGFFANTLFQTYLSD